jgi:hypothetical protein
MNRIARVVAGTVVAVAIGAAAPLISNAAGQRPEGLELVTKHDNGIVMSPGEPGQPGRTWAYWGRVEGPKDPDTDEPTPPSGSYRATCVWLGEPAWPNSSKRDGRLLCNLVLTFGLKNETRGASLVAEGLIRKPRHNALFARASPRKLAITGGTGRYDARQGYISLETEGRLSITFADFDRYAPPATP